MKYVTTFIFLFILFLNSGSAFAFDPKQSFLQCDSQYFQKKAFNFNRLTNAAKQLGELKKAGQNVSCARQIYLELFWLNRATANFGQFEKRLADFNAALNVRTPDRQSEKTGLWGACYEPVFMKMEDTLERMKPLKSAQQVPPHRAQFMDAFNSPELIARQLRSFLISDIPNECIDHRDEVGSLITNLTRYVFRKIPTDYDYHPDLSNGLRNFLDNEWQNPETGFWGAWYKDGDRIVKTDDLSMTFHIISYYHGEIKRWPEIIRTLLAMKNKKYPFGWLASDGRECSHHAYDVVRILRLGWPHMSEEQKNQSRAALTEILNWSINENYDKETGEFKKSPYCNLGLDGDTYEYGMKLWKEIGFIDPKQNFWSHNNLPVSVEILKNKKDKSHLMD